LRKPEQQLAGQFCAHSDSGLEYVICERAPTPTGSGSDDWHVASEGRKTLYTTDGMRVIHVRKGLYQIAQTGVYLISADPNAP